MKRIGELWIDYRTHVIPKDAPDTQIKESRRAFYAGAAALFQTLVTMLDPGTEATDADLAKMDEIENELQDFGQNVKDGVA